MPKPVPVDISVSRTIAAPADVLYDLVADIEHMPDWSPETTATAWLGGADRAVVGARFEGRNAIGRISWKTKPTITVAEPGREFAFSVPGKAGARWLYTFVESDGTTTVTETVTQKRPSPAPIRFLQRRGGVTDRAAHLRQGMEITLQRLAAHAETIAAGTSEPSSTQAPPLGDGVAHARIGRPNAAEPMRRIG
ncbi:MAG: SRPBCC family protein [Acidimicrobiales bacterium]